MKNFEYKRDKYGSYNPFPAFIGKIIHQLEAAEIFSRGVEKRNKSGTSGIAINADVYGWRKKDRLAVLQIRECVFSKRRWNRVRKNYYLAGYNEDGSIFAHPINSIRRSALALKSPQAAVQYAQCKIFQCTIRQLKKIVRQGDLAFIPCPIPCDAEPIEINRLIVDDEKSHLLEAKEAFLFKGKLFVRGSATLIHLKGQHSPASIEKGSWRVQVGYRATPWDFSKVSKD
jgi:hypothetical protein